MAYSLEILVHSDTFHQKYQIEITEGQKVTFGRHDCAITLLDPRLSRKHLLLTVEKGNLVAKDLESKNGSFLNGKIIDEDFVGIDDEITIGDHSIKITRLEHYETGILPFDEQTGSKPTGAGTEASVSKVNEDGEKEQLEPSESSDEEILEELNENADDKTQEKSQINVASDTQLNSSEGFPFLLNGRFKPKQYFYAYGYYLKNLKHFWQMTNLESEIYVSFKALLSVGFTNALLFGLGTAIYSLYGGAHSRFEWIIAVFGQNLSLPVATAMAFTLVTKLSFPKAFCLGVYAFYLAGPLGILIGAAPIGYQALLTLAVSTLWAIYGLNVRFKISAKQMFSLVALLIAFSVIAIVTVVITLSQ